jgi:uncharacterized OB-fold protein
MPKINIVCSECGSSEVMRDAWCEWHIETQEWVVHSVYDHAFCEACEAEAHLNEVELSDEKYAEIMRESAQVKRIHFEWMK